MTDNTITKIKNRFLSYQMDLYVDTTLKNIYYYITYSLSRIIITLNFIVVYSAGTPNAFLIIHFQQIKKNNYSNPISNGFKYRPPPQCIRMYHVVEKLFFLIFYYTTLKILYITRCVLST